LQIVAYNFLFCQVHYNEVYQMEDHNVSKRHMNALKQKKTYHQIVHLWIMAWRNTIVPWSLTMVFYN
jgi:hypothetical protein